MDSTSPIATLEFKNLEKEAYTLPEREGTPKKPGF
jgi:hypothetical protein